MNMIGWFHRSKYMDVINLDANIPIFLVPIKLAIYATSFKLKQVISKSSILANFYINLTICSILLRTLHGISFG